MTNGVTEDIQGLHGFGLALHLAMGGIVMRYAGVYCVYDDRFALVDDCELVFTIRDDHGVSVLAETVSGLHFSLVDQAVKHNMETTELFDCIANGEIRTVLIDDDDMSHLLAILRGLDLQNILDARAMQSLIDQLD